MKIFNTLQELWSYCLFCPVCKQSCRTIDISVGPEPIADLLGTTKQDNNLCLNCDLIIKNRVHNIDFDIDCANNSVKTRFLSEKESTKRVISSPKPYFYMYLFSDCKECGGLTHVGTASMEIDIIHGKILNIGIDNESIYFLKPDDKYHITFEYRQNLMYISKCIIDEGGSILDLNSIFKFPIVNLDLTNQEKCVSKIKTILIFS